jgi:quinol monooxygenase YgiN
MAKIYTYAKFFIPEGKAEAFKALATRCSETVGAREPGTVFYEWFLNADETECIAIDCYEDMDALTVHVKNNSATMKELLTITTRHLEIFGENPMAKIGGGQSSASDDEFFGERFLGKL